MLLSEMQWKINDLSMAGGTQPLSVHAISITDRLSQSSSGKIFESCWIAFCKTTQKSSP